MDLRFIIDTIKGVKLELYRYRFPATIIFILATSAVLVLGYLSPKTYTSEALLHADSTNILKPLLSGSAEVTSIERVNEAREVIQSRSLLEQVALDANLFAGVNTDEGRNAIIADLRRNIRLRVSGGNFLELSYASPSADQSFKVVSAVLSRFLEKTVRDKRAESRNAFEFIDSQVQTYKRQLEDAEAALKEFNAQNQDGTESSVQARIENLRSSIEDLRLKIQGTESEVTLTRQQLSTETPFREVMVNQGPTDIDNRLVAMRDRLDALRLQYHDSHPDIVNLLAQIDELEQQKRQSAVNPGANVVTEKVENPIYETLRLKLANGETELEVQRKRLASLERLLEDEYARAERVAENQAELKELTRDYSVTKGVYEDMLQRREKARLSMSLDVEGQGVRYRIQEPASYPTRWNELQLYEVGAAGPVVGVVLVLGLLTCLVLFDQRVRSDRALLTQLPEEIPLLATVPHYSSTFASRLLRWDVAFLGIVLVVFMAGYAGVLVFSLMGIQPENLIELVNSRLPLSG